MYSEKALTAVNDALASSRQKALSDAESRKADLYAREPAFGQLESQVARTGAEIALSAFGEDASQRLPVLRQRMEELRRKKRELLAAYGLPEDYLDPHFSCSLCQDTGFVSGKRCSCFRQRLQSLSRNSLPQSMGKGFEDFDLTYYPEQGDRPGSSPRRQMAHILERVKEYADCFGPGSGSLLFLGKTGLGKTHLSMAVGGTIAAHGFWVEYTSAQSMIDRFEKVRFDRGATPEDRDFTSGVLRCDLLILDDLGSEFITSFSQSVLYHVLNERLMADRPILISTNLDPAQLNSAYSERIASRVLCGCTAYAFSGKDIRLEKRLRRKTGQEGHK